MILSVYLRKVIHQILYMLFLTKVEKDLKELLNMVMMERNYSKSTLQTTKALGHIITLGKMGILWMPNP